MTTLLLVRHAAHDLLGHTLAGRTRDIGLNARGHAEAHALVERLAGIALDGIHVSPRRRAKETVAPLAAARGMQPVVQDALDEIDFGDWSGRTLRELATLPGWRTWCEARSRALPPGGETIGAVQRRVATALAEAVAAHPDATLALVSHGDVVKAALAHYLGISLDRLESFDIAPASVSVVAAGDGWHQVRLVNHLGTVGRALAG